MGNKRDSSMSDTTAMKHKSSIEKIPASDAEVMHYDAHPSAEEMAEAIASAKLAPLSRPLLKLYCFCAVAFLCSTMNGILPLSPPSLRLHDKDRTKLNRPLPGYDGSIFGSLPAMKSFRDRFNVGKTGPKLGYISAMYTVGTVVSLPFTGPACDFRGRRAGILLGSLMVVASTVLSALAADTPAFVAGRFFLGFGVSIVRCASSIWCAEISPPAYRGVLTAFYNCTYAVGALMAAGVTRGSVRYTGDAQWRVPVWCQLICPAIVAAVVLFFPESPRWLYAHGREHESRAFLTKYHGDGNPQHVLVRVQMQEYSQVITRNGSDKKWCDYSDLYKNRAARWRMLNALIPSVWGQCSGNAVVSYYLPAMLMTTGMTRSDQILNINLGYTAISAVASYVGASLIDKMGRRPTSICTSVACSLCFAGITAGTGIFAATKAHSAASAGIAFIFLFGWCYNFGMTPLQALYPVECLSYEQRGKGLAFVFAFVHCLAFVNQFCFPIALQDIGWKTYIVFIVWDLVQATISHLFSVETKGRSLEEMTAIFDAPNPVQASLRKVKQHSSDV
ncbi:Lactose permease [Beauveria bassiana]|uniref:Lactose permease n=1 Tax=Beauveria bassiana TaxID=176275 RepID=A0A2N6NP59_BEABA|nr:Lactose permease [Beauveria bassiana]